jgi:glycosyltransferase involved in cell wall biosynthesis
MKSAIARYDHAFFCSLRDRRLFSARSSSVLPNAVQTLPEAPRAPDGSAGNILIVGSLWYAPNRHGVDWFLERCWPEIAARCPALSLRIVGPAPAGERKRWAGAVRTEAPGFVDDLGAEYAAALFAIAPIHYGGGTCIKFLEAAAHSRACIATGYVFSAFDADFKEGYSAVVARDARQMIESSVRLAGNAERRNEIARRAFEATANLYNIERFTQTVQQAVRRVMTHSAGG